MKWMETRRDSVLSFPYLERKITKLEVGSREDLTAGDYKKSAWMNKDQTDQENLRPGCDDWSSSLQETRTATEIKENDVEVEIQGYFLAISDEKGEQKSTKQREICKFFFFFF